MAGYLRIRLLAALPVVFGVSVLVFATLYLLPGDPVYALTGEQPVDKAIMERLRQELGLNDPPWLQYGRFLGNALQGDLGVSLQTRRPLPPARRAAAARRGAPRTGRRPRGSASSPAPTAAGPAAARPRRPAAAREPAPQS